MVFLTFEYQRLRSASGYASLCTLLSVIVSCEAIFLKKTFVSAAVVISTIVLMLWIGVNFSQAAEKTMDKDMMVKQGDMMMKQGQMMMDKGKNMKEGMMK